jgi:hypothetical protein
MAPLLPASVFPAIVGRTRVMTDHPGQMKPPAGRFSTAETVLADTPARRATSTNFGPACRAAPLADPCERNTYVRSWHAHGLD